MTQHSISFEINPTSKIIIELEKPLKQIDCCQEVPIYFYSNNTKILLSTDYLQTNITILRNQLTKALENKLALDNSITKNIGYLFNQDLENEPGLVYENIEGQKYWIGQNYMLWNYEYATWLYNDKSGAIIFEITPIYPGNFADNYTLSYDKWIKQYKPLVIENISHETAHVWYEKTKNIYYD